MNGYLLIDAVVQQTMVFIAQLATAGGVRAPLARVAEQVFIDLTNELHGLGVRKNVIASMFGMALRTYHRRIRELSESKTDTGKSVWEAVLGFIREREPVSGREVLARFVGDDPEIVSGVLSDLAQSGVVSRAGRGEQARYRIAEETSIAADDTALAATMAHLVWLAVYRNGPVTEEGVRSFVRIGRQACVDALATLVADRRVVAHGGGPEPLYTADRFEVPVGAAHGWEAAVLDHFQAMVSAIIAKLTGVRGGAEADRVGGSTWSLDVWPGHPLEAEATTLLRGTRAHVEELRGRIDEYNRNAVHPATATRVVFYAGQHVNESGTGAAEGDGEYAGDESVD